MQTLTPNFTVVALQKWAYGAKITKIVNFWYKFAQKGYIPLSNFFYTKFGVGEGVPGSHPHAKFHHCGFKNVGLQPSKSRKMLIFGINLPLRENSGSRQKKLNIGAQLQISLYAMTP